MGMDASASAVIGIAIDYSKLFKPKETVKAFEHDWPSEWTVDPKTGKALWKVIEEPIPEYDAGSPPELCGHVMYSPCYGDKDYRWVVALHGVDTDSHRSGGGGLMRRTTLPANIEEEKQQLKEQLEPLGLWNEDMFGLWAIQNISI